MDRRVAKSIAAIYRGFGACLAKKKYSDIAVEDILQSSQISRSTFYAHFKTKDDVLDSLLRNIFHHVFSPSLTEEATHDFSHASVLDYEHLFIHTLYHLQDEKVLIGTILASEVRSRFLSALKEQILPLVSRCVKEGFFPEKDLPTALYIDFAAQNFVTVVVYWFEHAPEKAPSEIVSCYFSMND